jgi:predicted metalloenzyme YecM
MSGIDAILGEVLGDYHDAFKSILIQLQKNGINIDGCALSHIGLRTATVEEYEDFKQKLKPLCAGWVENVHNGRPIAKLDLHFPILLDGGFRVSLIELMPPKPDKIYPTGIEHWGVVIGAQLEEFGQKHEHTLTGRQDQGPYCQPFFITFTDGKRVKFYDIGLKEVVEKEGGVFLDKKG